MKRATVMGLGIMPEGSGVSAALFLARQGYELTITDLRTKKELQSNINKLKKFKNIKFVIGKHRVEDFKNIDLLVRNPGVRPDNKYLKIAKKNKVKVVTDIGLFLEELKDKAEIVGITGTRGKSTTTSLIYEILKKKYGKKVWLGGNIGQSPLTFLKKIKKGDVVVLELSSFQLYDLKDPGFKVGVITNFYPDHLNFYDSLNDYWKDKAKIAGGAEYVILGKGLKKVETSGKRIYFKKSKFTDHKLVGDHNQDNIGCAWEVGKIFKVPEAKIKQAVKQFKGVPNRLEFIRELKGVKFYNDTTATHPKATVVALQSFEKGKVILISGGNSKNLDLKELVEAINKRVKYLIKVPGTENNKLPKGFGVKDLKQAVQAAWAIAEKGDIILFSPGLTWLPQINEFKRGEEFVKLVRRLK